MAETRILPKHTSRSTGIERTTGQVARPNSAAGNNATSHVSAAPGVSREAHQHVVNARNPALALASHAAGRARVLGGGRGGQDATVELLPDLRGRGAGATPAALQATSSVQLVERPPAQARIPRASFSVDMIALMGSLLDQYAERAAAIGDRTNADLANAALSVLRDMMQAPRPPVPVVAVDAPAARASAPAGPAETSPARLAGPNRDRIEIRTQEVGAQETDELHHLDRVSHRDVESLTAPADPQETDYPIVEVIGGGSDRDRRDPYDGPGAA